MPICTNCGVEVEEKHDYCPLCGTSLPDDARTQGQSKPSATSEAYNSMIKEHDERVRLLFKEIFGFIALAAALVVLAIDLAYGGDIDWSRYPLVSLAYLWLSILAISALKHRIFLLVAGESLLTLLLLFLLDRFTGGNPWFLELALPLMLILSIITGAVIAVIRHFKLSIFKGISTALIGAGIYALCTEIVLHLFLQRSAHVSWSLIAAAAVLSIILFLFLFEKNLKKRGSDLDKYFHV